jgi:hypothetical protein
MANQGIARRRSGGFRRGDAVIVRSLEEILATLDADTKLDGLPFMPEMIPFCDHSFRVYRRAERTCVEGLGMRGMNNTVFLAGLRCDGSAHGGCQRGCLFFWNEAWLRPAASAERQEVSNPLKSPIPKAQSPVPVSPPLPTTKGDRFYCQSTELGCATTDFPPGRLRHYVHDLRLGELSLRRFAYTLAMALVNRLWWVLHGRAYYQITGRQKKTLHAELNLQPGELVRIKSPAQIRATLDAQGRNRGLSFEPAMGMHFGRRYRVAGPVRHIIAEETGKMVQLSNTVILEGVVCEGVCVNCPRANYLYWREIWLERV